MQRILRGRAPGLTEQRRAAYTPAHKGELKVELRPAEHPRRGRLYGRYGRHRFHPNRPLEDQWPCLPASIQQSRARSAGSRAESQPELEDTYLVALAKRGSADAYERIIKRYRGFVRLKASSYFLLGGDSEDLIQEGLVGLYKAIRDFRSDRESSFRNFAELCITRQIITAVKTASRNKHAPLNQYVSFAQSPAAAGEAETTLEEILPGPISEEPAERVIASEELSALVSCLSSVLSELESRVLSLYLDGHSYEQIGERLECDTKTVDNALQRVKRKVAAHIGGREVLV